MPSRCRYFTSPVSMLRAWVAERSLKQQGAIQFHYLVGEHHQTLEVARLGAEVVAGDVGAMGPQHLDHFLCWRLILTCSSTSNQMAIPSLRAWSSTSNSRLR